MPYATSGKRLLDLLLLIFLLPLAFPAGIFVWGILLLQTGKPFFTQVRIGLHEKPFRLYKFRTMNEKQDKNGNLLSDNQRLTSTGLFFRKYSLDELPQLLNVLKGDMSLIGPRPLLPQYLPLYDANQRKRHLVRPGITGLAQVNGRNNVPWQERFAWDIQYAETVSLRTDLQILSLTFIKLFTSSAIHGDVLSQKFSGN
jgi:lipopolysaccharide/colanic/teichoic acid biosynthesis glycosyltransferase